VSTTFPASKYAGVAATAMWTFSWLMPACLAGQRVAATRDSSSLVCMIVSVVFVVLGCGMTIRFYKRMNMVETKDQPDTESWSRRLVGWFAEFIWCAVAGVWNLAIAGLLIRAAQEGQFITLIISIPFSLIGWLLLLIRFVSIGVAIESFFRQDEIVKREP
jgi:hypothetical protein